MVFAVACKLWFTGTLRPDVCKRKDFYCSEQTLMLGARNVTNGGMLGHCVRVVALLSQLSTLRGRQCVNHTGIHEINDVRNARPANNQEVGRAQGNDGGPTRSHQGRVNSDAFLCDPLPHRRASSPDEDAAFARILVRKKG